jgi:hypothetical protein
MNKCGYCGRENANDAVACRECGTSFLPDVPVSTERVSHAVSIRLKCALYFGAWGVAAFVSLIRNPADLRLYSEFPIGLFGVFAWERYVMLIGLLQPFIVLVGWFIYLAVTIFFVRAKRRGVFWSIYGLLCVLLLLNFVGCGRMEIY